MATWFIYCRSLEQLTEAEEVWDWRGGKLKLVHWGPTRMCKATMSFMMGLVLLAHVLYFLGCGIGIFQIVFQCLHMIDKVYIN